MALDDSTRCLRKPWYRNKSHLPKYSSLPELQLFVKERPLYHCRQCGLSNPLIVNPVCLWCTRTCKEAKHEFKNFVPRARRASVPSRAFIQIDLSPSLRKFARLVDMDSNRSAAPSEQTEMNTKLFIDPSPIIPSISPLHQTTVDTTALYDRCINSHPDHIVDMDTNMENGPVKAIPEGSSDPATATRLSSTSLPFSQTLAVIESNNARTETESLTQTADGSCTLPPISKRMSSAPLRLESVDRSHSDSTNAMKPTIAVKVSRETFNVGCADKIPTFHLDDHAKNVSLSHDETTPNPIKSAPHSPKQHFRPLRRKNHLHVMPSSPDSDASEPIAISLTLHHSPPPTSSHLSKKSSQILTDYLSPHPHTRPHSHSHSIVTSISSGTDDPVTPPMTPTHQRSSPNSAPSKIKTGGTTGNSSPESSPVRLGHPSRPYYTAIRKNGISPPSPRTRPQSQPPPSSFHLSFDLTPAVATPTSTTTTTTTTNASRHLSMSAMLPSPSPYSAFSLSNDDDDDDNADFEIHSGPTNSARLSLSSSIHRLSYNNHTHTQAHDSRSLSRAKGIINNGSSGGVGFSMSGETELRMALATSSSSPSGVATLGRTTQGGFRFRETAIQPPSSSENITNNDRNVGSGTEDYLDTRYVRSRDGFMGRVKKLRKGLKEMLMNKNTTTATTTTATT